MNWNPAAVRRPALQAGIALVAATCLLADPKASSHAQDAALFQQVIRRSWMSGNEGQPKEVTFQAFSVGSPYSYRPVDPLSGGSPDGPGGRLGTRVYPVRATFTVRETYSTELQYNRRTRDFSCFVTAQNYWTCNIVGGGYDTQTWRQVR
jgi:hypothetical protein